MNLDAFLHHLHFEMDKVQPPDWEVDWEDAPLTYKLYRGLPVIPLSSEVPLTLEGRETSVKPDLRNIGHFLWYGFGLSQYFQTVLSSDSTEPGELMQSYRRLIPSGGALYPNELYVYVNMKGLPAGIYHYDAAHHRLVLLREGDFDSYVTRALGNRCNVSSGFGTVFVSTVFWKNFFKYHNFVYRLQGLDTGVLIAQLLEVVKRFGFSSGVCFQFLDRAVHHLLGLAEREESVYAVVPLSVDPGITWLGEGNIEEENVSAAELCRELEAIRPDSSIRSKRVREYPMLIRMNRASMLESSEAFRRIQGEKKAGRGEALALPRVNRRSYDLASVCRKRVSPGPNFVLGKVSSWQLSVLLQEAMASFAYRNDLDGGQEKVSPRVSLVGCLYGIEGIPDGAYSYDSTAHALRRIRSGDHRHWLQRGMFLHHVNLFQVPICLHVIGDRNHLTGALGYRGYRIQQMEAGMLVQCLLLAAGTVGLGGHPLLGFDAGSCDQIYRIDTRGKTSLIQIPVGPYRFPARLEGGLHG
ncbi:SagB family peptide dehydrogenase [Paludifilum halophilum]|uniref:NADH oxidase n=1 Tax=Paludifilum halophilum TaxID=1642702 RepID=A0A235B3R9_9BACL|nr:SagB family peptide dehydrogenase [Paludifilum halophilum]OYD06881.1 NADH oxidase [Paludifilum halophilum]